MRKQIDYRIWNRTRTSFFWMIATWCISVFIVFLAIIGDVPEMMYLYYVSSIAHTVLIFSTFVLSIMHLRRYKEKGLAVTALVFSSLGVFQFIVGFFIGLLLAIAGIGTL
jgi:uncharacterized membrane protein YwaF